MLGYTMMVHGSCLIMYTYHHAICWRYINLSSITHFKYIFNSTLAVFCHETILGVRVHIATRCEWSCKGRGMLEQGCNAAMGRKCMRVSQGWIEYETTF